MICNKDIIQKCGWCLSTDMESSWRVDQRFLFLMNEWVMKVDLFRKDYYLDSKETISSLKSESNIPDLLGKRTSSIRCEERAQVPAANTWTHKV